MDYFCTRGHVMFSKYFGYFGSTKCLFTNSKAMYTSFTRRKVCNISSCHTRGMVNVLFLYSRSCNVFKTFWIFWLN